MLQRSCQPLYCRVGASCQRRAVLGARLILQRVPGREGLFRPAGGFEHRGEHCGQRSALRGVAGRSLKEQPFQLDVIGGR